MAFRKTLRLFSWLLVAGLFLSACTQKSKPEFPLTRPSIPGRTLESYQAVAKKGMIAVPNKEAAGIGLDVLKKGGNAADAAIAVSLALSVVRPQSTGLGGGGFLLYYNQETKKTVALDFREMAPIKATRDMYLLGGKGDTTLSQEGALAVAVPRLVAGLGYIYENYGSGKIPWADLVQPSIHLAENGFKIYPHLAESIAKKKDLLSRFPSSKAIFLSDGGTLKEGELLIQKDLAKTLKILSHQGWKGFYQGAIAKGIVDTIQGHGGILTEPDFKNIKAFEITPVEGTYHGHRIVSMPPPSSGGTILIEILNILEHFPLKEKGPGHLETVHIVTEAMKRAFMDRAHYLGDPRFVKVPVKGLLSKEYAKGLAETIRMDKAVPSQRLSPMKMSLRESESTTHFSIVDGKGNAVSSTQTINYTFGSGLVAEGTGIVLNNEMDDFSIQPGVPNIYGLVGSEANAIAPGKIPLSSMSPTLVFDPSGGLEMVVGTPGGPRIITAVLNTILHRLEYGATPLKAVAAKRLHHQWLPDHLHIEEGWLSQDQTEALSAKGHALKEMAYTGLVMLVAKTKQGWLGVCDPRGVGVPLGY